MSICTTILSNFNNTQKLHDEFVSSSPVPILELKNFLPEGILFDLVDEIKKIEDKDWTEFTRNGSYMKECKDLSILPVASKLVSCLHSSSFLKWLELSTGITGLIPDPHLTGAGYSKSFTGDVLKPHVDFNWNDHLKLHRALSFIVYLTPDWKEEWGGALNFYDINRKSIVRSVSCGFNNAAIWKYHKRGFHGYDIPLLCPEGTYRSTFRLFYYTSNSTIDNADRPHRSLYWYDQEAKEPYDLPTKK